MAKSKDTGVFSLFSTPWNESDVVLRVEHALKEAIELKDDKYEAMISFLMFLYPANMLDEHEAILNDNNILQVIELADKYEAKNLIKQCMKNVRKIQPITAMHLLPFAERNQLPLEEIIDVIKKHVSMDDLNNFSQNLSSEVLAMAMLTKGKHLEDIIKKAQTQINELGSAIKIISQNPNLSAYHNKILKSCTQYDQSPGLCDINDIVKSLK
ncbi:uncharacterized protein LOC124448401 isoform X1 [Xenia sp. Carnegie-2017]|uniref:uncharacterized protein LOC124448401 isoform X1 n=1 Tax=Xenia sp. Carnegie-2017 TaxID=2897299 RepID=UPI001F03D851|nr:uncharacterized protein LOC124448401 isoform X1 [Xenia sp. Carnegie-2017]